MSKKGKGLVLDPRLSYGVMGYEDEKARLKHQTLVQEYQELEKEANGMRSKLEAAKHRKLMLATEVWFLRKRYEYLVEAKNMDLLRKQRLARPPGRSLVKQTKNMKEQAVSRKEASRHRIPKVREPKLKKKRYIGKEVATTSASLVQDQQHHKKILHGGKENTGNKWTPLSVLNYNGRTNIRKESSDWSTPVLDLNQKERMQGANNTASRKPTVAFDLNQDSNSSGKEASLPTRAPIFDLNEISVGDEDFLSNAEAVKFEEAQENFIRGLNDEQQNDLKLSICRNAGEGPSRVGKRKISWQDPVALRV